MSIRTGTTPVRQKSLPVRRWETTRRVAYDADTDDEDEDKDEAKQVTLLPTDNPQPNNDAQPTGNPQPEPQIALLIKATQALARSLNEDRVRAKPSVSKFLKPEHTAHRLNRPQNPSVPATPKVTTKNNPSHKDPVEFSRDEWIIEEFDYSSRWSHGYYGRWIKVAERSWEFHHSRFQPKGSLGYIPPIVYKPKITFMSLPPEIRNTIYEYAVPERSVLIIRTHPKKEARRKEKCWADEYDDLRPGRSRLTHEPEWNYTSEDFVNAMNLLLTCKEIKSEVETFLYSRLLFCFTSLKSLRRFLHTAPKSGVQSMRQVFIMQDGYGNSQLTLDQKFRQRYYKNWERVCALLGQMAPNLKHLKLKVYDREWPSELSGKGYNPIWKTSILKTAPALVPKVEVHVHHQMIYQNEDVLRDLARCIEDSMMTKEGRDNRDRLETERVLAAIKARRDAREERERKEAKLNAPPPRTELAISMADIPKQANKAPTEKKFRSKGLERFDKIDLSIYSFHAERY